jgi:hypothetical protein
MPKRESVDFKLFKKSCRHKSYICPNATDVYNSWYCLLAKPRKRKPSICMMKFCPVFIETNR